MKFLNPWTWRYWYFGIKWNARKDGKRNWPAENMSLRGYLMELQDAFKEFTERVAGKWENKNKKLRGKYVLNRRRWERAKKQYEKNLDRKKMLDKDFDRLEDEEARYSHDIRTTKRTYILFVGIFLLLEAPFNFLAFQILGDSQLFAISAALLVGVLIAVGGHYTGMFAKEEWHRYRFVWLTFIVILVVALTIGIGVLREQLVEATGISDILGIELPDITLIWLFVVINLLGYVIVSGLSFLSHPRYKEHLQILKDMINVYRTKTSVDRLVEKYEQEYQKYETKFLEIESDIKSYFNIYKTEVEKLIKDMQNRGDLYKTTNERYRDNPENIEWKELECDLPVVFQSPPEDLYEEMEEIYV